MWLIKLSETKGFFCFSLQKVSRGKLSFLHTLFLENEAHNDRNSCYGTMLFMSKQVSPPKISSILQKMKIGQNSIYAFFARSPSIVIYLMILYIIVTWSYSALMFRPSCSQLVACFFHYFCALVAITSV